MPHAFNFSSRSNVQIGIWKILDLIKLPELNFEYNICPQNAARARTVVSGMPDQDQLIQIGLGNMH